jgi:hypothetical protein
VSTPRDFLSLVESCDTVTLSSESPILKTLLLAELVRACTGQGGQVFYLDFDLQFSSLTAVDENFCGDTLHLFAPAEKDVISSVVALLSDFSKPSKGGRGMVVVDSLNSLQNLLIFTDSNTDSMKANRESATLLTLLQQFAERRHCLLVIANLTRARPSNGSGGTAVWEKDIVGGRMSRLKSDAIVSLKQIENSGRPGVQCLVDYVRLEKRSSDLKGGISIELDLPDPILH